MVGKENYMNLHDKINSSKALANRVIRYHAYPTHHNQSVGEHSNRVLTIFVELWGMPRAEVLFYIANHDKGEFWAGDTPFGAKKDHPLLKEGVNEAEESGLAKLGITLPDLTDDEFIQFKVADILEMFEFGTIERMMGNRLAIPIMEKTEEAICKITQGHPIFKLKAGVWLAKAQEVFGV
jgi:hypothetical protein